MNSPLALKELTRIAKEQGLSSEEVLDVIEWLANPTVRPIVGVQEFVESPYYMGALKGDGTSSIYPEVMKELVAMNSGAYSEVVLTGGIGCLSADTEYLTPTGWQRMDSFTGGPIAQWEDGLASWVTPEYHVYPAEMLYHLKTKYGIDQQLSSEHRVLTRSPKSGHLSVRTATEVVALHNNNVKGFGGKFLTTFSVRGETLPPSLLRVQVMVCADGWFRNMETGQCYLNLKKDRKILRARTLLTEAGIAFTEFKENAVGYVRFSFHAPWKTKQLSSFCWGLCSNSLRVVVEESLHWDGHKNSYFTTLKDEADFMSYAGSAAGYRTVVDFDERALAPHWVVRFNHNTEVSLLGVPKTAIQHVPTTDGKKYCFTVPSGFFITRRNGRVVVTGNSAKTTCALYSTAYQLYKLSCYESPHDLFGLDAASELVFVFQSLTAKAAKAVDYQRFRAMIERSPYFREYFPFDKEIESELLFPNRIIVRPVSGAETAAIGQNVFGGIIDEVNFMAIVEKSKSSVDGGVYDQATALYNSISKRRKSRFGSRGTVPGLLCLVSSRRYPGQFTDVKEAEAKDEIARTGKTSIYIYDKRTWDIKPPGSFLPTSFHVFIGDESRKPRVLAEGEEAELPPDLVVQVPDDYREDFDRDIMSSLRDIAGIATLAKHPFIVERETIRECMREERIIFSRPKVDFVETKLVIAKKDILSPHLPRFVHCDLAITGDSAGFAVGTVTGFKKVNTSDNMIELLPEIWIDAVLEINPPKGKEIQLFKVREIIHALKKLGMNIRWVTFDQFQSRDSMQLLQQAGYAVGYQSVDSTTAPYDFVKNALYDHRLSIPLHEKLEFELASLEKDTKKNKIDHPPRGSKDIADALAGVVYGLTMRRELWSLHGVTLGQIPASVLNALKKDKLKEADTESA